MSTHNCRALHNMKTKLPLRPEYVEFVAGTEEPIQSARLHAARAVNQDLILALLGHWTRNSRTAGESRLGRAVVESTCHDLTKRLPSTNGISPRQPVANETALCCLRRASISADIFSQTHLPRKKAPNSADGRPRTKDAKNCARATTSCRFRGGIISSILKRVNETPPDASTISRPQPNSVGAGTFCLIKLRPDLRDRWRRAKHAIFPAVLPEIFAEQAEEALKTRYNLEFLGIQQEVKERELKDRLIERLQQFILELGYGFCFTGHQRRLTLRQEGVFHRLAVLPPFS